MGLFSLYLHHCDANCNPITAAKDLFCRGFNRQVIDKCPVLVYSTVKDLKIGKATLECVICLNEFQDYNKIRLLLKSHHVFHSDCIDVWLLSHMDCPVCRARLIPDVPEISIPITKVASINTTTESGHELTGQQQQPEAGSAFVQNDVIIPPCESRMLEKFPRSHSTDHSLAEPEENVKGVVDMYTLRLPEHVRKHNGRILHLETSDVGRPAAWSAKRACYKSSNNVEQWSLSMTLPSVSLGYGWGLHNETTCWTPLRMPFYRVQGAQKPSPVPLV